MLESFLMIRREACGACLVRHGLGVASALDWDAKGCGASSESRAGDAKSAHDGSLSQLNAELRQALRPRRADLASKPQIRLAGGRRGLRTGPDHGKPGECLCDKPSSAWLGLWSTSATHASHESVKLIQHYVPHGSCGRFLFLPPASCANNSFRLFLTPTTECTRAM